VLVIGTAPKASQRCLIGTATSRDASWDCDNYETAGRGARFVRMTNGLRGVHRKCLSALGVL
jgi:hypothetical protein